VTSQVATDANTVVRLEQSMIELVAKAQAGDAEAFGSIYKAYHDSVLRYCYYRVKSLVHAEDICAEVFTRAFTRINTFQWQGKDFGAWLTTIARNLVADHFKRNSTRSEVTVESLTDANGAALYGEVATGNSLDPVENLLQKELAESMHYAIELLNPLQRECIKLRFYDGLSCQETALKMGRNEGAVKTLQYRAVRTLGRILSRYKAYV